MNEPNIVFLFQVFVALMLFFGHLKTSLNHNEFISALAGIGILGGIHMFSWLVVFQYRRNLLEEHRLMATLVASAPLPPTGKRLEYLVFNWISNMMIFQMTYLLTERKGPRHHLRPMTK